MSEFIEKVMGAMTAPLKDVELDIFRKIFEKNGWGVTLSFDGQSLWACRSTNCGVSVSFSSRGQFILDCGCGQPLHVAPAVSTIAEAFELANELANTKMMGGWIE